MVIVKLMGGLGNQMFQYAFGRDLATRYNTALKFDIGWFDGPDNSIGRHYGLDIFEISEDFGTLKDIKRYSEKNIPSYFKPLTRLLSRTNYVKEVNLQFSGEIYNSPDNSYLDGYWQSEKYFAGIRQILIHDFSFRNKPDSTNIKWLDKIRATNSVSIHVRRGDYVNIAVTNEFHGLCNPEYYLNSCKVIESKVESPEYYIFSDDITWAKENLYFAFPCNFIENNDNHGHEDLRLMINCKHNIIANSSFSWWGAWLNTNPEKTVIAPQKWFNDPTIDTKDIVPDTWIRL
jgi:hypothetical protein